MSINGKDAESSGRKRNHLYETVARREAAAMGCCNSKEDDRFDSGSEALLPRGKNGKRVEKSVEVDLAKKDSGNGSYKSPSAVIAAADANSKVPAKPQPPKKPVENVDLLGLNEKPPTPLAAPVIKAPSPVKPPAASPPKPEPVGQTQTLPEPSPPKPEPVENASTQSPPKPEPTPATKPQSPPKPTETSPPKPAKTSPPRPAQPSPPKETKTSPKTSPKKPSEAEDDNMMAAAFTTVSVEAEEAEADNDDDNDNDDDGDDNDNGDNDEAKDQPKEPKPKKITPTKKSKKKRKKGKK